MGKKAREKRDRKDNPVTKGISRRKAKKVAYDPAAEGDLRFVEAHVDYYLQGVEQADVALKKLGRDAAETVTQIARRLGNAELEAYGRKLTALKPQVETNMAELRRASVVEHVEGARKKAPSIGDTPRFSLELPTIAIFDPLRVVDALVRGGRPRLDKNRVGAGDVAWFPRETDVGSIALAMAEAAPAAGEGALELRLTVSSGLVFVGPPEASDGPRLGSVRLDPFRTQLDEYVGQGRFARVDPGHYAVHVRRGATGVAVTLVATEDEAPFDVDLARLGIAAPTPAALEPAVAARGDA